MLRRVEDQSRVKNGETERRKNLDEKQDRCSLWGVAEKTIA
jgi:hypothetical protein